MLLAAQLAQGKSASAPPFEVLQHERRAAHMQEATQPTILSEAADPLAAAAYRAEAWAGEPFLREGEDTAQVLAPGTARRRALDDAIAEIEAGRREPSSPWKVRYGLMLNELGVVIDDGVCARLSEQHFYVTATTSGVDRIYQQMLKWNAQWRLDVDITNVTAALAAVNLAGPLSRQVLAKVCDDVDLSAEAFPYLGVRQGKVAGIPARILRVGFVGELGYEVHVPARHGERLWDELTQAGAGLGIRPFGVETQRLLRLEKGHVIISQDTDGMTHPAEIDMQWAIGRKKPFFVGKRSIEILEAQPLKRKLVGFTLPKGSPQPLEGHLVLNGPDISGNVTSCEYSQTVGQIIGLAYAGAHQATPGMHIPIRVEGGAMVHAKVVQLPFHDPDNQRQEL